MQSPLAREVLFLVMGRRMKVPLAKAWIAEEVARSCLLPLVRITFRRPIPRQTSRQRGSDALRQNGRSNRVIFPTTQMAMLKPYQRIIGLGLPVVPLILEELNREPNQWFWALEAITEQKPRSARGRR